MTTTEEELRRAYINEQNLREYQRNKSALNRFNNLIAKYNQIKKTGKSLLNSGNNIANAGQKMQNFGSFLQKSSNPYINQLGNKIGNTGTNLQNTGNNLQSNINNRFNVNNNPVPNSSSVAVQQQPTSLTGKLSNGLEQNSLGLSNPQNVTDSLPRPNQYTSKLFGNGFGQSFGAGNSGTVGNGVASSNLGSSLPMGADKLSFAGQGAGQTASGVGTGVGASTTATGTGTALGTTAGSTAGTGAGTALGTTAGSTATTATGTTLGTTAGTTATTAGTMASSAVPVIGWGIAIASLVANAINSYKKKQQGKAIQASQQAGIDNEMLSEQQGQEAMQNIANQNQQFQANNSFGLQPDSATQEQLNQERIAELMSMMSSQPTDNTQLYGSPTGYASGINQQQVANILNNNLQNNGQIGTAPATQQPQQAQPTQQLNGAVSQTADPNAQPQQTPQFGDQVYQINGGTGRVAQMLDQIRQGYKDNTENTMGNTYFDPSQQKTFANRVGEALGTTQRIASNPYVQGLIAGGVNYANGGNIGNSLSTGIEWAKNKANSDRYEQLINGNNKRSLIGGYTASDYNTKLTQDYKEQQQKNWQAQQDYKKETDKRDYDEKVRHNKAQESATMARVKEYARHNGVSEAQSAKKLGVYTQYQKEKQQLARDKFEWEKTHPKNSGSKTTTKKKEEDENTAQGGWAF